jgi:hypothetical protein
LPDRDLLEIFDAALPRLEGFGTNPVPRAGAHEAYAHGTALSDRRTELGLFAAGTGVLGFMTWFFWMPWLPLWFLAVMAGATGATGLATLRAFLRLAFSQRLEQALPPGTDATTAQLEDGSWNLIRAWTADAFIWNRRVDELRLEVSDWQLLRDVPEARDIDWSERSSMTRAESLIAAIQGMAAERSALAARRVAIEHEIRRLDARLYQLNAAEEAPMLTLAAPESEDPTDDG